MEIGKLIHDRRLELGLTLEEVGNAVGVGKSTVKKWEDGYISNMRRDKIAALAKILKLKPTTLITGEINFHKPIDKLSGVITNNIYNIPIYDSVSAGFGTLALDNIVGYTPLYIETEEQAKNTLCINVQGDSMYPKIENGDTIQVHKQSCVDSGDIGVVLVDGEDSFVKKIIIGDERLELQSINPMYPPIIFEGKETERVRILGKVKTIIKHL